MSETALVAACKHFKDSFPEKINFKDPNIDMRDEQKVKAWIERKIPEIRGYSVLGDDRAMLGNLWAALTTNEWAALYKQLEDRIDSAIMEKSPPMNEAGISKLSNNLLRIRYHLDIKEKHARRDGMNLDDPVFIEILEQSRTDRPWKGYEKEKVNTLYTYLLAYYECIRRKVRDTMDGVLSDLECLDRAGDIEYNEEMGRG